MTRTVAIVENDAGIRENLVALLNGSPGYCCVGACGSVEEALAQIPHWKPDVVLMDINLPRMSGIECVARLPELLVLMLTVYEDGDSIFRALKAGASGYLIKRVATDKLLEAIDDVCPGGSPMSCHIARKVVQFFHQAGPSDEVSENLSPSETEILELLVAGCFLAAVPDELSLRRQESTGRPGGPRRPGQGWRA